jgi:hypothetical protein
MRLLRRGSRYRSYTARVQPKITPCAPTEAAYELVGSKREPDAWRRAIARTGSFVVDHGMQVRLLEVHGKIRKIRVLTNGDGAPYQKDKDGIYNDQAVGRECWVAEDALATVTHASGARVGDVGNVGQEDGYWPCAADAAHYGDLLVKPERVSEGLALWREPDLALVFKRTGSVIVKTGNRVRVLETESSKPGPAWTKCRSWPGTDHANAGFRIERWRASGARSRGILRASGQDRLHRSFGPPVSWDANCCTMPRVSVGDPVFYPLSSLPYNAGGGINGLGEAVIANLYIRPGGPPAPIEIPGCSTTPPKP